MGQRRHGENKRKRKTIDLNSLSKKSRKLFRQGNRKVSEEKGKNSEEVSDVKSTVARKKQERESYSSSEEEETNPYQTLVATLSHSSQHHKEVSSDDSDGNDEGGDDSDDNDEAGDDLDQEQSGSEQPLTANTELDIAEEGSNDGEDVVDKDSGDVNSDSEDDDEAEESEDDLETETLDEQENEDNTLQDTDPFFVHFERDLEDKIVEELKSCTACNKEETKVAGIGASMFQWSHDQLKPRNTHRKEKDLTKLHVKQALCTNLSKINKEFCHVSKDSGDLTPFQNGMFSIINNYQDMLYTERTADNGEETRLMYCIHALNHVLKTRKRVISHNTKIKQKTNIAVDEEYRDQGLTRPKVLMVLPFRESAKRVVDMFIQLLNPTDQSFVANKTRFNEEYGIAAEDEMPKTGKKPEDYDAIFTGNVDDHFRIGIGVSKKTLKLYTKFYMADIILASPLGLRTLIGSEGDKERDYDFLNSVEVLILDQADIFMMQNWDHIMHIMKHLHLQPQESHGVDFSRVRMWTLNGWSQFYRQTLMFSSVVIPELTALFNKHCHNYAGKYQFVRQSSTGSICQIAAQLPQVFHRVDTTAYSKAPDDRFDFFAKKILPHHRESIMSQTLVFVPSYFDFVRLRNYFRRENINFVQINEYSKDKTVNTARNVFFHKKVPFMLYTERFHFYKRMRMRGIRHIVFYGLPQYPHLYSEMCNMLEDVKTSTRVDNQTCTVLYTRYDAQRLAEVVGTERAAQMVHSHKSTHMFVTGDDG